MRQLLQDQLVQEGQPEVPTACPHRYARALEAVVEEIPSVTLILAEKRKWEPGADPPAKVVSSASEVLVPWQRPGAAPLDAGAVPWPRPEAAPPDAGAVPWQRPEAAPLVAGAARTGPLSGRRWVLWLLFGKAE